MDWGGNRGEGSKGGKRGNTAKIEKTCARRSFLVPKASGFVTGSMIIIDGAISVGKCLIGN